MKKTVYIPQYTLTAHSVNHLLTKIYSFIQIIIKNVTDGMRKEARIESLNSNTKSML